MWQVEKILRQIPSFIQGILENKASEFLTPGRVAALMSYLFWASSEFYHLTFPNKAILILAAFFLTLGITHLWLKLWDQRKGRLRTLPDFNQKPEPQTLPHDDTLDHAEQKQHFLQLASPMMNKVCSCMQQVVNQVHKALLQETFLKNEIISRYCVHASIHFIQTLEDDRTTLSDFLAGRESLSNEDFAIAQQLLISCCELYEKRRPLVRNIAWEVFPNLSTYNFYKEWKEADHDMRFQLKRLRRDCEVLAKKITDLNLPDPWRWNESRNKSKNLTEQSLTENPHKTFTIDIRAHELRWRTPNETEDHLCELNTIVPNNASLALYVATEIKSPPDRVVEEIGLEFMGKFFPSKEEKTERLSPTNKILRFDISSHAPSREHEVRLTARTAWNGAGTKEEKSPDFTVLIPHRSREGTD